MFYVLMLIAGVIVGEVVHTYLVRKRDKKRLNDFINIIREDVAIRMSRQRY